MLVARPWVLAAECDSRLCALIFKQHDDANAAHLRIDQDFDTATLSLSDARRVDLVAVGLDRAQQLVDQVDDVRSQASAPPLVSRPGCTTSSPEWA